jgi:O-antigen ligase
MRELFDSPFLDAHNEALQILSITGILGLASYLGMQLCLLSACLRRRRQEGIFLAGCVGITAYLLQGLVNNPSIFTLPPFFIFLGMVENRLRKAKSEHPS